MKTEKITIHAIVNADRQKAWDYYTLPQHIVNWNFASDDWHCPSASNDMQVGGKYVARMEAKDGSFGFEAIYDAINVGENFTYIFPDARVVSVSFEDKVNATLVTVSFDAETENPLELQRQGWQAILDNYKKYTESN
jgi:uncharacterized protein YndB with AHSA1/START domain